MITMTLPFPPTVNTYYTVARGRKILSKKGRQYKTNVTGLILESGHVNTSISGDLELTLVLVPPCRRKRDIDNYCKALLDAITSAGVWGDDSQIKRLNIEMMGAEKPGRVSVSIRQIK